MTSLTLAQSFTRDSILSYLADSSVSPLSFNNSAVVYDILEAAARKKRTIKKAKDNSGDSSDEDTQGQQARTRTTKTMADVIEEAITMDNSSIGKSLNNDFDFVIQTTERKPGESPGAGIPYMDFNKYLFRKVYVALDTQRLYPAVVRAVSCKSSKGENFKPTASTINTVYLDLPNHPTTHSVAIKIREGNKLIRERAFYMLFKPLPPIVLQDNGVPVYTSKYLGGLPRSNIHARMYKELFLSNIVLCTAFNAWQLSETVPSAQSGSANASGLIQDPRDFRAFIDLQKEAGDENADVVLQELAKLEDKIVSKNKSTEVTSNKVPEVVNEQTAEMNAVLSEIDPSEVAGSADGNFKTSVIVMSSSGQTKIKRLIDKAEESGFVALLDMGTRDVFFSSTSKERSVIFTDLTNKTGTIVISIFVSSTDGKPGLSIFAVTRIADTAIQEQYRKLYMKYAKLQNKTVEDTVSRQSTGRGTPIPNVDEDQATSTRSTRSTGGATGTPTPNVDEDQATSTRSTRSTGGATGKPTDEGEGDFSEGETEVIAPEPVTTKPTAKPSEAATGWDQYDDDAEKEQVAPLDEIVKPAEVKPEPKTQSNQNRSNRKQGATEVAKNYSLDDEFSDFS